MTAFRVGQRVRIKWSDGWPELAGEVGTIVGTSRHGGINGTGEWLVAPDAWGSPVGPRLSNHGAIVFGPNSRQLEPLSDSNTLVSWESMRDLWVPDDMREAA